MGSVSNIFEATEDSGSTVLGNLKLPQGVGFVPEMGKLFTAKNDDIRNEALSNIGATGTTTLLTQVADLGGPEIAVIANFASWAGKQTVAPTIKIIDGYLSNDHDKIAIGKERLKAGLDNLDYKLTTGGGVITLTGDVVGGAGDIVHSSGGLLNNGMDWLVEQTSSKQDAQAYEMLHKAGVYLPGSPYATGDGLQLLGNGVNWVGRKLDQFGNWVTDVTGAGAEERDAVKSHGAKADELQKKYDEAHKLKIVPPPEVAEINTKVEAYTHATQDLLTLVKQKESVKGTVLDKAYQDYKTAYQAMVSDSMYKAAPSTIDEQMHQIDRQLLQRPAVQDATYVAPRTSQEAQARNDAAAKRQHELELFLDNPVTPDFKTSAQAFDQNIGKFVQAKGRQRVGELAEQSYANYAKGFDNLRTQLAGSLKEVVLSNVQLKQMQQRIAKAEKEGMTPEALAQAHKDLGALEQTRTAQAEKLEALEKATGSYIEQQQQTTAANSVYRARSDAKNLGTLFGKMEKTVGQTLQLLTNNTTDALDKELAGFDERAKQNAGAAVIPGRPTEPKAPAAGSPALADALNAYNSMTGTGKAKQQQPTDPFDIKPTQVQLATTGNDVQKER